MATLATLIMPNGAQTKIEPENGTDFTLKELYRLIETDIVEVVRLKDNMIMIICEEGKLRGRPSNPQATSVALRLGWASFADHIVGTAVLCHTDQFR